MTPRGGGRWSETVLFDFNGQYNTGQADGGLIMDGGGDLYGTALGGPNGVGTIFELTPGGGGWNFSTVYARGGGCLILDQTGNLYGCIPPGGIGELSPGSDGWTYTCLLYTSTNNLMTGFCWDFSDYGKWGSTCPSYSYVQKSDVQPYFNIATAYGFANYMFQSNEGMSMPAHQFLFTGTSAPVAPNDQDNYDWYWDFVANNVNNQAPPWGCWYNGGQGWPQWAEPNGSTEPDPRSSECYTHDSLVTTAANCNGGTDSCDRGIDNLPSIMAWGYYVEPSSYYGTSIWDPPAWIPEVCYGQNSPCLLYTSRCV